MDINELSGWGISQQIAEIVENGFTFDEETGEVFFTTDDLDKLEMALEDKINQLSNYFEKISLEAEAFKKSKQEREKNQKRSEKKAESIKRYITALMEINNKDKLVTRDHTLSYRKSKATNIFDESKLKEWINSSDENKQKYFKYKEPEIAKKELGDALKQGEEIPGIELVENKNLQIK